MARSKFGRVKIVPGIAQAAGMCSEQQDSLGFSTLGDAEFISHGGILAVVADGMGVCKGREVSELAVKTMLKHYAAKSEHESIADVLRQSMQEAMKAVHHMVQTSGLENLIGTSIAAAVVNEYELYWSSAGNSRIYLYNGEKLALLNGENEKSIYSSQPVPLNDHDKIIICTDGLYQSLSDSEMVSAINSNDHFLAEGLVQTAAAKHSPYQDNMTVIVLGLAADRPQIWMHTNLKVSDEKVYNTYFYIVLIILFIAACLYGYYITK